MTCSWGTAVARRGGSVTRERRRGGVAQQLAAFDSAPDFVAFFESPPLENVPDASGYAAPEREFQERVREVALRFLDEAGHEWAIALEMAREHLLALASADPADSNTSQDPFEEQAADLATAYELACRVVHALERGVADGMDSRVLT
jgi:hypothetical protein